MNKHSVKQQKVIYAEKDKQSNWILILKYLWKNRKTVIRIVFWLCWLIKKVIAWFEDL